MAEEKYCPVNSHPKSDGMCKKEKCAWWDILARDCAITVIAKLGLEGSFNAITKEIKR